MSQHDQAPEAPKESRGQVADAVGGNWVDTRAPAWTRPYLRLSRADRPIGTWLLFIPCIWGVLLGAIYGGTLYPGDAWLVASCGAGAWLMRGAGCTWNDISDRKFDAQVARTRSRPIPSGQVSVRRAALWMMLQALAAFSILISYNTAAIWVGVASVIFVGIYPFAKRFTWWPQVFLGLAFNWGALLGWTAHRGGLEAPAIVLYLAGIAWTLFYDTIYAHQDTEDDALIGVKSTARLFGDTSARWLWGFGAGASVLFALAGWVATTGGLAFGLILVGVAGFAGHMIWQMRQLDINDPAKLLILFRSNRNAGLIPVAFLLLAAIV